MTSRSLRPLALMAALTLTLGLAACGEKDEPEATDITSISSTTSTTPTADTTVTTPTDNGLTVVVDPSQAKAGSTLKANVRNDSDQEFTYGAGYEIDRAIAGGWEAVELPQRPVPQIAYVAPPGDSGGAIDVMLPASLEPGLYRVVIARDDPRVGEVVGDFEVTR